MRQAFTSSCWLLAILAGAPVVAASPNSAETVLAVRNLALTGKTWIVPEEVELRRQIESLGRLERNFHKARDKAQEMLRAVESHRQRLIQLKAALVQRRAALEQNNLTIQQRQQIEIEAIQYGDGIAQLEKKVNEELNVLDEQSPLSVAMVGYVAARNEFAACVLSIEKELKNLAEAYRQLSDDAEIAAAVAALPAEQRLGPAENYVQSLRPKLDRAAAAVFLDESPIYRRSGRYRVGLIVGDATPATFTYSESSSPPLVTSAILQAAGIAVDPAAPAVTVRVGTRSIAARSVTLPSLRLGKHVVKNVQAVALPPEAEDLGAQFGPNTFQNYRTTLDPLGMKLRLEGQ